MSCIKLKVKDKSIYFGENSGFFGSIRIPSNIMDRLNTNIEKENNNHIITINLCDDYGIIDEYINPSSETFNLSYDTLISILNHIDQVLYAPFKHLNSKTSSISEEINLIRSIRTNFNILSWLVKYFELNKNDEVNVTYNC